MAQQQPSANRSGPPDRHRFPFLRDLAHPHWNGINGIATIIAVFVAIVGIVVGIIFAQGQGVKPPPSNGQLGIASPRYSMTATGRPPQLPLPQQTRQRRSQAPPIF